LAAAVPGDAVGWRSRQGEIPMFTGIAIAIAFWSSMFLWEDIENYKMKKRLKGRD
jgi:UDP-N-acetylmuramyl pentapeptide phosphotransferase/UDP-N-acetylglucosamine-1-phosphate transferase